VPVPNLLLRDIPENTMTELKQAASDHGRSLQAELLFLVNEEAERLARTRNFQALVKPRKLKKKVDLESLIREDRAQRAERNL
jgi:plasmid stability protein